MTEMMTTKTSEEKKQNCCEKLKVYFAPSLTSAGNTKNEISENVLSERVRENLLVDGKKVKNMQEIIDLLLHEK